MFVQWRYFLYFTITVVSASVLENEEIEGVWTSGSKSIQPWTALVWYWWNIRTADEIQTPSSIVKFWEMFCSTSASSSFWASIIQSNKPINKNKTEKNCSNELSDILMFYFLEFTSSEHSINTMLHLTIWNIVIYITSFTQAKQRCYQGFTDKYLH